MLEITNVNVEIEDFMHIHMYTPDTLLTIEERGSKLLKQCFSIAICRQRGDKWLLKTLFLTIFLCTFVDSNNVFDCRLSGVMYLIIYLKPQCPWVSVNQATVDFCQ